MNEFYILSPETQEEKNELENLMRETNKKYKLYERKYFIKFRYLNKVLEIFYFLYFVFPLKIKYNSIEIIGGPCLRNRMVSIFLNIKLTYYLRCLHPNPEHLSSVSDKIDFLFKKLRINNKFTNNYIADKHIITSFVTRDFILARSAAKNIIDIGPVWLKDIKIKPGYKKRIFFITQSFKEHNLIEAQNAQKVIIDKLIVLLSRENIELILKVHPRDTAQYQGYSIFKGDAQELLNSITTEDIVVSAFSTLAFELTAIGANVKFVSYSGIAELYEPLYKKYNIEYFRMFELENIDFLKKKKITYQVFSPINVGAMNEHNS